MTIWRLIFEAGDQFNNLDSGEEHFGILIPMIKKWVLQILVFTSSFKAEFEMKMTIWRLIFEAGDQLIIQTPVKSTLGY